MKLHEYQARDLLAANGVATTRGRVARTAAEARVIAEELGGKVVVKAQIHAGGRGKGRLVSQSEAAAMFHTLTTDGANNAGQVRGARVGGVRLADTATEAEAAAAAILGKHLVSIQTGPEGKLVKSWISTAESTTPTTRWPWRVSSSRISPTRCAPSSISSTRNAPRSGGDWGNCGFTPKTAQDLCPDQSDCRKLA